MVCFDIRFYHPVKDAKKEVNLMQNAKLEKWIVSIGMAVAGYHALLMQFNTWPQLPAFVNGWGLALAGLITGYGVYILHTKY
jgi:hypothetical protein